MFFVWFAVCFMCYFARSLIHLLQWKKRIKLSKKHYAVISILAFVYWFSWFSMVCFDPFKLNLPPLAAYGGLALFLAGVFLVIWSHKEIRGFDDKGYPRMTGVYSKVRHPMYVGFSLWVIGLPLFMQSLASIASSVIWIGHMAFWAMLEEKELEKKYPQYREYKKKTWF